MKKVMVLLMALLMVLQTAAYAQANVAAVYDLAQRRLVITGQIGEQSGRMITVLTDEYSEEEKPFSEQKLPASAKLFTTGEGGMVSFSLPLSSALASGKYRAYFSTETDGKFSKVFLFVNPADTKTKEALRQINQAADRQELLAVIESQGLYLGVDTQTLKESHLSFAAGVAWSRRASQPDGAFALEGFYDSFLSGLGAAKMVLDKAVDDAIREYGTQFGVGWAEYSAIPDGQKSQLGLLLQKADYQAKSAVEIYADCLLLAELRAAESWGIFRDSLLKNAAVLQVDVSAGSGYQKVREDERYKIFVNMYNEKNSYWSFGEVKKAFDAQVAALLSQNGSGSQSTGGNNGGPGQSVTSDKNIMTPGSVNPPKKKTTFPDLEGHYAKEAVERLAEKKIISGYPDGSFQPQALVTRSEYAKLLSLSFTVEQKPAGAFSDVQTGDWFAPYVGGLAAEGVIKGVDGRFLPQENITRQDAAVMLYRLAKPTGDGTGLPFGDREEISGYAKEAVAVLSSAGILMGDGKNFYPLNPITRGEAAVLIDRICTSLAEEEKE